VISAAHIRSRRDGDEHFFFWEVQAVMQAWDVDKLCAGLGAAGELF